MAPCLFSWHNPEKIKFSQLFHIQLFNTEASSPLIWRWFSRSVLLPRRRTSTSFSAKDSTSLYQNLSISLNELFDTVIRSWRDRLNYLVCCIIHHNNSICSFVVCAGDRSESFLACCIPLLPKLNELL